MNEQPAPTPQAILITHAETYRHRQGVSHETWAEALDAAYCKAVPPDQRNVTAPDLAKVSDADTYAKLRRAWDQQVRRWTSGERHLPMELLWAWVDALDEPYRSACASELVQSLGYVGAEQHPANMAGDHESWGDILQTFGGLTERMGKILADGSINEQDRKEAKVAKERIRQMQAELVALEHQLDERAGPNLEAV